jgi:alpha-ketoglutarate-dependent taurine dioxygenase
MGGFELRPVSGHIGAEVGGVDLRGLDDPGFEEIHAALLQHHVLFFRETDLSDAEHMELAARFGPVSIFPLMKVLGSTEPTFQVIDDSPDSPPAADDPRRAAADHGTQRREVRRCVVDGDRPF